MATLYQQLVQKRADLIAEGKQLIAAAEGEGRTLTEEEKGRDDELFAQLEALQADLAREEKRRELERQAPAALAAGEPGISLPLRPGWPRVGGVHDRAADRPWGSESGAPLGEFLVAVARARLGMGTDMRLIYEAVAQGAGEAVGSDGGFLVPRQQADDILLRAAAGEVWSRVRRRTLSAANSIDINVVDETSRATGSRHGGVQGYWVDEGVAPTASRPKFAQLSFKPRKVAALGYATDELLADAGLIESLMLDAFVDELRFLVENAIMDGTGAGQPAGILRAAALISVAKETGQAAKTVVFENIVKLWSRMYARSRANAVWLTNQDIEPQLYTMNLAVGTGGVPVYLPANGAAGSPLASLMGRPVVPVEYAKTLGTEGDLLLADLSQYWLFDRGEAQRASSMHVAFTTDETAFRVTYRVDGQSSWRSALTPFQGTNTQSPFVTLAARA